MTVKIRKDMLYLLSGKMQSGKDTVAKIWRMLSQGNKPYEIINDLQQTINTVSSDWQIKHYAHKVKEVCALITGTKVEQWYDEEFKNKPLGEEWNCYPLYIIDTIESDYILFTSEEDRNKYIENYHDSLCCHINENKRVMTPRLFMQLVGTECIRNIIHPNAWVNALLVDYKNKGRFVIEEAYCNDGYYNKRVWEDNIPNWLIPDTRFPNEVEIPKKRFGAKSIRIERIRSFEDNYRHFCNEVPNKDMLELAKANRAYKSETELEFLKYSFPITILNKHKHPSETSLDNYEFDYHIKAGNIEELIEQTKEIMIKEKIL